MALQLYADISKTTTTSDGTNYTYICIPAATATKPTFLLLHGFPSSSFDWRHIVPKLKERGYGIIAPDLLGYGDTDKPVEVEAYSHKRMSDQIIEILEVEGLKKVIGVGHDWGSVFLSMMALAHPSYFSGMAFLAVGYNPPGPFDLDLLNSLSKQYFGHGSLGYMKFFNEEDAAAIVDANAPSLTSLLYSTTPEAWKIHMGPAGAAKKWLSTGQVAPPPSWMTRDETETHIRIFKKGGYTGPLNWYKSYIRGIDEPFYSKLTTDEDKNLDIPALLVTAEYDYVCHAAFQKPNFEKHLTNGRMEQFACSHWIPSEKPDDLVVLLDEWVGSFDTTF